MILAPFELERFAWHHRDAKLSVVSAVMLIAISRHGYAPVRGIDVCEQVGIEAKGGTGPRKRADFPMDSLFGPLVPNWILSDTRVEHRKVRVFRLHPDVHVIPDSTQDGQRMHRLMQQLALYRDTYRNGAMIVALILYSIYFRQLRKSADITDYLALPHTRLMTVYRILARLSELGVLHSVSKAGNGDKAKLLVYPIGD